MTGFENLDVWQKSCRLAVEVYKTLQNCKDYGLKDQMTRAAVSIPSNIAEGAERRSSKDFVKFLAIAKGSSAELRTQLYIARSIGLITAEQMQDLTLATKEISGMLQKLIESITKEPKT